MQRTYTKRTTKYCSNCFSKKPLTEFHRWTDHADGYRPYCKLCWNAENRASYWRHRDSRVAAQRDDYRRARAKELAKRAAASSGESHPHARNHPT